MAVCSVGVACSYLQMKPIAVLVFDQSWNPSYLRTVLEKKYLCHKNHTWVHITSYMYSTPASIKTMTVQSDNINIII